MNADEQLLRARLQGFEAPGEIEAGERGRRLVLAAFAERIARAPAARCACRGSSGPLLAALLAAGAVAVAGHLRDDSSPRRCARRSRPSSSTSGVVLALGRGVAYTVDARGRVRALGPATRRRSLAARHERRARVGLGPRRRARRRRAGALARARAGTGLAAALVASSAPCRRAAASPTWRRGALYVVGGDGRGAHRVAAHALAVAPAWRPRGTTHELAFAVPGGVRIVSADGARGGARVAPARSARSRSAGAPTAASLAVSTARA